MARVRAEEDRRVLQEEQELQRLRQLRDGMQKEQEKQIELQKQMDLQIQEEIQKVKIFKENSEKYVLSTYIPTSENDIELFHNHPSFKRDESSILSQDRSMSDEYSSFINDIRTVYELQDEDSKYTSFLMV